MSALDQTAAPTMGRFAPVAVGRAAGAAVLVGGAGSLLGWLAAQAGTKIAFALVLGVLGVLALALARRRSDLLLAGLGLSVAVLLHKSVGPQDPLISSGPISVYVTSFDLVLAAAWAAWLIEGRWAADLVATLRRPAAWVPLLGGMLLSASLVVAEEPFLAAGEMVRMVVMWLTYVFLGARLRTRRDFGIVLAALGAVAVLQLVVVVLQWRTGGVLGLDFLGIPEELGERTLDGSSQLRPFGTVIHPVFLGAMVGTIGVVAAAASIHLVRGWQRWSGAAVALASFAVLLLSQTRAASLAFLAAVGVLVLHGVVTRRLGLRIIGRVVVLALVVALPLLPTITSALAANFRTEHFALEVRSRVELNDVAIQMWQDHPEVGVGLNNFEQEMAVYDRGLIFGSNPVHNLFLLVLAESGVLGLLGLLLAGAALLVPALQLLREHEPLHRMVGAAMVGVLVFMLLEEQLGFSLRQDQPRTVFWIVAGMSLAASRMAALTPPPRTESRPRVGTGRSAGHGIQRPGRAGPRRDVPPSRRVFVPVRLAMGAGGRLASARARAGRIRRTPGWARARRLVMFSSFLVFASSSIAATMPGQIVDPFRDSRILVTGIDRATGLSAVYVAPVGGELRRVSPDDGRQYTWASWAPGASAVVWAARENEPDAPANLEIARIDGSVVAPLTAATWSSGQPKWTDDGTSIVFSAFHPQYPRVAIYRLDLRTLTVTNLSAVTQLNGAFDGDPRLAPGGRIVLARGFDDTTSGTVPNQIWSMAGDGTDRRQLTDDPWFNTDPDMHPHGGTVAISSYRGEGHPSVSSDPEKTSLVRLQDWLLVERDLASGEESILTLGLPCFERDPHEACSAIEGPAFVPNYTPDGDGIAFVSVLSRRSTCVCGVERATGAPRVLVESQDVAIGWFDIAVASPAPPALLDNIGVGVDDSRILVTGTDLDDNAVILAMRPDTWLITDVPLPAGMVPEEARWSSDPSEVLVVARVEGGVATSGEPHPAPPPGASRQEHFTLDMLTGSFAPLIVENGPQDRQLFRLDIDSGEVAAVTDPFIEDWHDGAWEADPRGNAEPVSQPGGNDVVFTNISTLTNETFLLRLDGDSGEVRNLTNATSGAVAVADRSSSWSPDGTRLVFVSNTGTITDLFSMDAATGQNVRRLTDDDAADLSPRWSPDGRSIAYVSYRGVGQLDLVDDGAVADVAAGTVPLAGWSVVVLDVETGVERLLVDGNDLPALRPVWSPDGARIAFIGMSAAGHPNLYLVASDGSAPPVLQPTFALHEIDLDWR